MANFFPFQFRSVESSCIVNDINDPYRITANHFQVHVAFFSQYQDERTLVIPTEEFLREIFIQPGDLIDVSVKEYNIYQVRSAFMLHPLLTSTKSKPCH